MFPRLSPGRIRKQGTPSDGDTEESSLEKRLTKMCAGLWETNKDCKSWEQGPSRVGLVYLANKNIECPVKTTNNLMTKAHMVKAIVVL